MSRQAENTPKNAVGIPCNDTEDCQCTLCILEMLITELCITLKKLGRCDHIEIDIGE